MESTEGLPAAGHAEEGDEIAAIAAAVQDSEPAHNELWLVSYADMMTLLFGFFAMLYLMNSVTPPAAKPDAPPPPSAKQETVAEKKIEAPPPSGGAGEQADAGAGAPQATGGNAGGDDGPMESKVPWGFLTVLALALLVYFALYLLGAAKRRWYDRSPIAKAAVRSTRTATLTSATSTTLAAPAPAVSFAELVAEVEAHPEHAHEEASGVDEKWLISYADLMTLLFGFFAMLYLMGPNFEAVKKTMENTFTKAAPPTPIEKLTLPTDIPKESVKEALAPPEPPPPTPAPAPPAPPEAPSPPPAEVAKAEPTPEPKPEPTPAPTATAVSLRDLEEEQYKVLRENLRRAGRRTELVRADADGDKGAGAGGGTTGPGTGGSFANGGGGGGGSGGGTGNGTGAGLGPGSGGSGSGGKGFRRAVVVPYNPSINGGHPVDICITGHDEPYSPNCSGNGLVSCLSSGNVIRTMGSNGMGSALEFYCAAGRTRVCLTWERCPWRNPTLDQRPTPNGLQQTTGTPDDMTCSPYGLRFSGGSGLMATCVRGGCGFTRIYCDDRGNVQLE